MNYKLCLIFSILLIISISAVSAADVDNQAVLGDEGSVDLISADDAQQDIVSANEIGTFTELQSTIWRSSDGDTIVLTKDYAYDTDFSRGKNGIGIYRNITIDGDGHSVDGKSAVRLFYASAEAKQVTFQNIKFINGGGDGNGGAILADVQIIVKNCTFTNNRVDSGTGGAISVRDTVGTLVSDSTFIGNKANGIGGAVSLVGNRSLVENCIFKNNEATSYLGGGLILSGDYNIARNNVFENNFAGRDGGGLQIEGRTDGIQGIGNKVINNTFTGNRARYGGGLGLESVNSTVNSNTFIGNIAKVEGDASLTGLGGALRLMGEKNEQSTTGSRVTKIFNNTFIDNFAHNQGGAVYFEETNLALYDNVFINNYVETDCGGSIMAVGAYSTISNNNITETRATTSGGAMFVKGANVKITGNIISDASTNQYGGAINIQGASATIKNNEFSNCSSSDIGGAIVLKGNKAVISNNIFNNNYAASSGGAIFIESSSAKITYNKFSSNVGKSRAGAVHLKNSASSTISFNTFENNNVELNGGAVYVDSNNVVAEGNIFLSNKVTKDESGGALFWMGDNANIKSNTFKGNTAKTGFAIYGKGSSPQINNNVFIGGKKSDSTIKWVDVSQFTNNKFTGDGDTYTPVSTTITASDVSADYNSGAMITATLKDANGNAVDGVNVEIKVGNLDKFLTTDLYGKVSLSTNGLDSGSYSAVISFAGNDVFAASTKTINVVISGKGTTLTASDVVADYNSTNKITATLKDANGKAISGAQVEIRVGNIDKVLTTNSYGKVSLSIIGLNSGSYTALISFAGDGTYDASSTSVSVVINKLNTALTASDVVADYNAGVITATLKDSKNKAVGGAQVEIRVGNIDKVLTTNSNGKVSLSLSGLNSGSYTALISFAGNENYAASATSINVVINSVGTTLDADDVHTGYNSGAMITATLSDANGNAIEGAEVQIELGNLIESLTTDENGMVSMSTNNLNMGEYSALISFAGDVNYGASSKSISVVIDKINTALTAPDVTVVSGDEAGQLVATLTNVDTGKAIGSATISVSIDGQTYTAKTNSKGQAAISTANLAPGTYTATVSYAGNSKYNPSSATSNVVVKEATSISCDDVSVIYGDESGEMIATLTNVATGKAMSNKNICFTINGVDYTARTNYKGQAKISTADIAPGTYTAIVSYAGNSNYGPSNTTAEVTVKAYVDISAVYDASNQEIVATLTVNNTDIPVSDVGVGVNIDGRVTTAKSDAEGKVHVSTADLAIGTYTADVSFAGNDNYFPADTSIAFTTKINVIISAVYDAKASEVVATLTNGATGKAIGSANVKVTINGVTTTSKTDSKGQVHVSTADLATGTYTADVSYAGNSKYSPAETSITFTTKIDVNISAVYEPNDYEIIATLTNTATGKGITSANVHVTLNGVNSTVKSDSKGQVKISTADLPLGTYTAIISYAGNSKYSPASLTLDVPVKTKVIITDIYCDSEKLIATLTNGATGRPITSANMQVDINGVTYTVKSNSKGVITLDTSSLGLTTYDLTISYKGNSKYNPSSTTTTIDLDKANMVITYVYDEASRELVATLRNSKTGKVVSSANMVVDLNGVQTTLKSNSKGQITFSTADFSAGTYVGTISYGGNSKYNPISAAFKVDI